MNEDVGQSSRATTGGVACGVAGEAVVEPVAFAMSGSAPVSGKDVTREELHFRRIDMRGYSRSDGLFEIEGRVTDRKPHDFTSPNGIKIVPANEPMHDMGVRLVIDRDMKVVDVGTFTSSAPYHDCLYGGEKLQSLKGLSIAAGWGSEVRKRLSGAQACTHLMELLMPMATTAYQSLTMVRSGQTDKVDAEGKPAKIDSCYAYGSERGVVLQRWPNYYTGPESRRGEPNRVGPGPSRNRD